jgi:branched-chain amino acid transport system substrate-binding protein
MLATMVAWLLLLTACSSSRTAEEDRPLLRVAFLQYLSVPSHVDLVSPSFLSFDLALHRVLDAQGIQVELEVVQMDTEGDPTRAVEFAEEVAIDPSYVAAVVAPFWSEPADTARILAEAGVPTLSVSPQSPSPSAPPRTANSPATLGSWRRFVPDGSFQVSALARMVEQAASPTAPEVPVEPVCIFAEDWPYSVDLQRDLDAALPAAIVRTAPTPGDVDAAVADVEQGCSIVVWTGAPDGAVELTSALPDAQLVGGRPVDFAADALKTVIPPTVPNREGVMVGALTCPCVDVSTQRADDVRWFVNAYQSENGLAPGIYAAEAWDAANVLAGFLTAGARDREAVSAGLAQLEGFDGVAREYKFDEHGELLDPRVGRYVAAGSRWLRITAWAGAASATSETSRRRFA